MTLRFLGGDGDQSYLSAGMLADLAEESWFAGNVNGEPAILLRMLEGPHQGEYVALTSRYDTSLQDQLEREGLVGAIVHPVRWDGDAGCGPRFLAPVGMAALEMI